jgi:ribosomal RNA assembly protein
MKFLNIPLDRIGVLISKKGGTKNWIEERTNIKIDIDSETGEIKIEESENQDPLMLIKIENIINAIGKGFSPENAMNLINDESDFFIFNLYDYVGKKENHVKRLKSRVIGKEGKTKKVLEELTGAKVSVYGHTISIISDAVKMNILKKSVDMILTGSKHATVYRFIEQQMKELRLSERYGR